MKANIVAVDVVLRIPKGFKSFVASIWRRVLWKNVDQFIHYFNNIKGYTKYYGISAKNSDYVPFKSNIYHYANKLSAQSQSTGEYVFSAGRSLRDYDTLIEAAKIHKLPTAILYTSEEDWQKHGTKFDCVTLPENVTLINDSGKQSGWIHGLQQARLTVVPILKTSLCASGIGTYLDAMALGKPVIITRGPGADDVLSDSQACFVEPGNARELAKQIENVWFDSNLAKKLSTNGKEYALSLGDEQALIHRVITCTLNRE